MAQRLLEETNGLHVTAVAFEPGARTHWHSHSGGQVLLVTSGRALVGGRESAAFEVGPGEIVYTEPGEEHWHGAARGGVMTHLVVTRGGTASLEEATGQDRPAPA